MKARDLIDFILENELENYEVMIQPPIDSVDTADVETVPPVPLEDGDVDWEEDKEELYIG